MLNTYDYRDIVLQIAKQYLGRFYIWGGDDPSGFDCSGFVIECLKSVGILPREGDWTANMLSGMFPKTDVPVAGDLVFWQGRSGRIIHVEIYFGQGLAIGASGGGSKTRSVEDAIKHNAFIKIRPVASRSGLWGYTNPHIRRENGIQ